MDLKEKLAQAMKLRKPYTKELVWNLQQALPDAKVMVGYYNIYLYIYGENKPNLKEWLYSVLETLPEIDHPLERVEFVVYENDHLNLMRVINPSEKDVTAEARAIKDKLKFSQPSDSSWYVPMPLDHPYYSDKNYFKKKKP